MSQIEHEPDADTTTRVCGYSFACEGVPNNYLDYDGVGKFLRCGRCKGIYFKDREAQRQCWKLHKPSCRVLSDSEIDSLSKIPTLEQCKTELENSLFDPNGGPELCLIIQRVRSLMDAGGENVADMALEFHTLGRGLIFHPHNIMLTAMSRPGMTELMLTDNVEQLLSIKASLSKQLVAYNGRPSEEYVEVGITDELEKKRVEDICEVIDNFPGGEPPSISFCYLYFNLLVAAVIQGESSATSVHDGNGRIRGSDGSKKSVEYFLATAALRRALTLWTDPYVLSSCGDAMAPAASLALTAIKHYADRHNLFGTNCQDHEIVPGLAVDAAVSTCLAELKERAGSGWYSVQLIKNIANLSLKSSGGWGFIERQFLWSDLPVERRAKLAMAIVHYIFENYCETDSRVASMEDCNTIFKAVCGMANPENESLAESVFKVASTAEEWLGPAEAGWNDEVRAFFFFLLRRGGSLCGDSNVVNKIKTFYEIEDLKRAPKGNILAKEKDKCLRLAMGFIRYADYVDKVCANPRCPKPRRERCDTTLCSGCRTVRFCGHECQVASWPSHKKECKEIQKKKQGKKTEMAQEAVD